MHFLFSLFSAPVLTTDKSTAMVLSCAFFPHPFLLLFLMCIRFRSDCSKLSSRYPVRRACVPLFAGRRRLPQYFAKTIHVTIAYLLKTLADGNFGLRYPRFFFHDHTAALQCSSYVYLLVKSSARFAVWYRYGTG